MRSLRKTTVAVIRAEIGLSLEEFAELVGKSPSTIESLEGDRLRLSEKTALAISKKFGVSLTWLLSGDPKSAPTNIEGKPWKKEDYEKRGPVDKDMAQAMIAFHYFILQAILSKQLRENPELAVIVVSRSERFLKKLQAEFGLDREIIDELYDQEGVGYDTLLVRVVGTLWDFKTSSAAPSPSSERRASGRKSS